MDLQRRFGGLDRLYGDSSVQKLSNLHVIIAGIGGVGSWCAEALARSGVGHISLIDLDHIAESNINRQIHALSSTLGKSKIQAMADRISEINPSCQIQCIDDFIDPDNAENIIVSCIDSLSLIRQKTDAGDDSNSIVPNTKQINTIILDCTDQVLAKIAMVLCAKKHKLKILVCGGAGGKTDPFSMRSGDISIATHDALLSRMRNILRRQYSYPKSNNKVGSKKTGKIPKMGVWAIWFAQETILPSLWLDNGQSSLNEQATMSAQKEQSAKANQTKSTQNINQSAQENQNKPAQNVNQSAPQGLSCAGYGSAVTITASMGLAIANQAISMHLKSLK